MRKGVLSTAIAALLTSVLVTPASGDEGARGPAYESDIVVTEDLSGGCIGVHEDIGPRTDIAVSASVVATGAVSISVTCHVWQRTRLEYHHDDIGIPGGPSGAAGAGKAHNYDALSEFHICTEIHAVFLAGAYHKYCPAH